LCIHGAYCDARIFNYLGKKIAERGLDVYAIDMLGHGRSTGPRGDPSFDDCLVSINEILKVIKNRKEMGRVMKTQDDDECSQSNIKIFILGHSLGCTFTLWYIHNFKHYVNGVILMAPYFRISTVKKRSEVEPSTLYFFYLLLRRYLTPNKLVKFTDVIPNLIQTSRQEISRLLQDPELNFWYSYRFIIDVIGLRNSKVNDIADVKIPVLILHGKKDKIVYYNVSEALFRLLNSKGRNFKLFDCDHWFYHALFYDQTSSQYSEQLRQQIVDSIVDWVVRINSSDNNSN
jgi:alpha-beta hydrolase superfamily lysophospholipase